MKEKRKETGKKKEKNKILKNSRQAILKSVFTFLDYGIYFPKFIHESFTTKKLDFCHENLRRKNFRGKFATNFPTKSKIRWKFPTKNFSLQNSLEISNKNFSLEISNEKFFVGNF